MPILNLKRISRLSKTLWYQIPRLTFQYSIEKNTLLHKIKLQAKKLGHLKEKTAENGYLNVTFRQKIQFNIASKKIIRQKNQLTNNKNGPLGRKMAKNSYLYVPFSQKLLFKVKKSFIKRSAGSKNFSRAERQTGVSIALKSHDSSL